MMYNSATSHHSYVYTQQAHKTVEYIKSLSIFCPSVAITYKQDYKMFYWSPRDGARRPV